MKSWKTSLCGVLILVGGIVSKFFPEYGNYGAAAMALGSGLGLIFARDNSVTSEQAGAVTGRPLPTIEESQLCDRPGVTVPGPVTPATSQADKPTGSRLQF